MEGPCKVPGEKVKILSLWVSWVLLALSFCGQIEKVLARTLEMVVGIEL